MNLSMATARVLCNNDLIDYVSIYQNDTFSCFSISDIVVATTSPPPDTPSPTLSPLYLN